MAHKHDSGLMAEWLRLVGHSIYKGWKSAAEIAEEFEVDPSHVHGVLIAWREQEGYEGWAFVLMVKEGRLYEVNASHCSCNGLEGQWEEEATSIAALRRREWGRSVDIETARMVSSIGDLLDLLESIGVS